MNDRPSTLWDRAAAARRAALAGIETDESPPPGFSTRVAARWAELRQNDRFVFWTRWSLRGALGALCAALMVNLIVRPEAGDVLLYPPSIEVPSLPTP